MHKKGSEKKKIKKKIQTEHFPNVAIKNYWTENFMFSYVQLCMYFLDGDNSFFFSCSKKDFLLSYIPKKKTKFSAVNVRRKIKSYECPNAKHPIMYGFFYVHAFATARSHIILISIYLNAFVGDFDIKPL